MSKLKLVTGASLLLGVALLSTTISQAAVVIGSAYLNNAASTNAVIGFAHGPADVTFSAPSPVNPACTGIFALDTLCFNSGAAANGYTVGGFLATGGATILTGSAAARALMRSTYSRPMRRISAARRQMSATRATVTQSAKVAPRIGPAGMTPGNHARRHIHAAAGHGGLQNGAKIE